MWPDGNASSPPARLSTNSEVALVENGLAQALAQPPIGSVNVNKSKDVHVGTKIVKVTQHVHSNEVVKGRLLGFELVSNARRLRCSIAVFVCWSLVAISGLAFYLFSVAAPKLERLDLGIRESWFASREEWQALAYYEIDPLSLPVKYVVIGHSALKNCTNRYTCLEEVASIQRGHLDRGWADIGPNFLVGGDGTVCEGRGANIFGAMIRGFNFKSISIMFLGDYRKDCASQAQFDHVNLLLNVLLEKRVLTPDYVVQGYCQISTHSYPPGPNVMNKMFNFKHWDPANNDTCRGTPSEYCT